MTLERALNDSLECMKKLVIISIALLSSLGCASAQKALRASFDAPAADVAPVEKILESNPFHTDRARTVSDEDLLLSLATPTKIVHGARVGVVPVGGAYAADGGTPLLETTATLKAALSDTRSFSSVTEVSTDFARAPNIGGLRDLAARYRTHYLLLYRHRFEDRAFLNPHAWWYATGVGVLVAPAHTLEVAGVLEATLYDVRTGTILFTAYERTYKKEDHDAFDHARKRREIKEAMLEEASEKLASRVMLQVRVLTEKAVAVKPEAKDRVDLAEAAPAKAEVDDKADDGVDKEAREDG